MDALKDIINPALEILPSRMRSEPARLMLLAIGLQESRFLHRRQIGGPARGFWQFERGGGTFGVMRHAATEGQARLVCLARGVAFDVTAVYDALERDDILAAAFARLLLWSDPQPLPPMRAELPAWNMYTRTWRPGRPHRSTWPDLHARALAAMVGIEARPL